MPLQQFDERKQWQASAQFANTGPVTIWGQLGSVGGEDVRIDTIQVVNEDTIDHHLLIAWQSNGTQILAELLVPARAGCDGAAAFDALAVMKPGAYHYTILSSSIGSGVLWGGLVEILTSGTLMVTMEGGYV